MASVKSFQSRISNNASQISERERDTKRKVMSIGESWKGMSHQSFIEAFKDMDKLILETNSMFKEVGYKLLGLQASIDAAEREKANRAKEATSKLVKVRIK